MVIVSNEQYAEELVQDHFAMEPGMIKIIRLVSPNEDVPEEPMKLLEVNSNTLPMGILPVGFPARIEKESDAWYPRAIIIEVTPGEYQQILADPGLIPNGWRMAQEYTRPG